MSEGRASEGLGGTGLKRLSTTLTRNRPRHYGYGNEVQHILMSSKVLSRGLSVYGWL